MKVSVAVVEPVGGHGGMNVYDSGLCRGLLSAGTQVSLYTCDETVDPEIQGLHFCTPYKKIFGRGNRWIRALRYLIGTLSMAWSAVKSGETIIHFHVYEGAAPELYNILLAKLFGRSVVLTVHDVESMAQPAAASHGRIRKIYRLADRFIVHNQISRRELIERLGVDGMKITVIPIGNYLEMTSNVPSSTEARRALGIGETKKVILFFGQIKEVKGLDLLIEALSKVAIEVPEALLVIAGRPWRTDFSRYAMLIDSMGVRDRCLVHLEYVPDDRVSQYYAAADVVVLPYRRIYQSGVILLAMGYGKAVIASDLPGMSEIIVDGNNGYLFSEGSKDALSKTLVSVLQSDREREEVGKRALKYVQQNHDWNQIGAKTNQLYQELLSERDRRSASTVSRSM
jgi:glycosyltransferase involved in cell wall biosynthesis